MNKRITFLLVLLVTSFIYSFISLMDAPEPSSANRYANTAQSSVRTETRSTAPKPNAYTAAPQQPVRSNTANSAEKDEGPTLPAAFLLVGTQVNTNEVNGKILVQAKGELFEYALFDEMLNTPMRLVAINASSIEVDYEDETFTVALTPPNILKPKQNDNNELYRDLVEMTPDEIGSRPRIMEHLFILIPTPYIADAQLVKPGLNPALFAKAGFQEDDLLKTVNGKSVTNEEELEAIKAELKTAHTLEFQVMRKGRLLTLYLDIPSEALEISL